MHDSIIKDISIIEDYWNHYTCTIKVNTHYALTNVDRLIFRGSSCEITEELIGASWIAEEIYIEKEKFVLHVLLYCLDGELRELVISFDDMEVKFLGKHCL